MCVCIFMYSLCNEIIETTINSKHTVCFNNIVNNLTFSHACLTALRSIHIYSERRYLTSHLISLLQSNSVNFMLAAEVLYLQFMRNKSKGK